jgi:hypothetical protein
MAIWLFPCNTRKKKGKSYSILSWFSLGSWSII